MINNKDGGNTDHSLGNKTKGNIIKVYRPVGDLTTVFVLNRMHLKQQGPEMLHLNQRDEAGTES